MNFYAKIISIILIFSVVVALPAVSLAQQGQLLQAEPSKVAMQALNLCLMRPGPINEQLN